MGGAKQGNQGPTKLTARNARSKIWCRFCPRYGTDSGPRSGPEYVPDLGQDLVPDLVHVMCQIWDRIWSHMWYRFCPRSGTESGPRSGPESVPDLGHNLVQDLVQNVSQIWDTFCTRWGSTSWPGIGSEPGRGNVFLFAIRDRALKIGGFSWYANLRRRIDVARRFGWIWLSKTWFISRPQSDQQPAQLLVQDVVQNMSRARDRFWTIPWIIFCTRSGTYSGPDLGQNLVPDMVQILDQIWDRICPRMWDRFWTRSWTRFCPGSGTNYGPKSGPECVPDLGHNLFPDLVQILDQIWGRVCSAAPGLEELLKRACEPSRDAEDRCSRRKRAVSAGAAAMEAGGPGAPQPPPCNRAASHGPQPAGPRDKPPRGARVGRMAVVCFAQRRVGLTWKEASLSGAFRCVCAP